MWFPEGEVPLLFEALPTEADAGPKAYAAHLDALEPLRRTGICAVNVPEILDGHYRTVDPVRFAADFQERISVPAIVNRVTVQEPADGFDAWWAGARQAGIRHAVLVGGESSHRSYVGPGVTAALARARSAADEGNTLGVVTIPTRRKPELDEPARLLAKQRAGADFAISQILGESESAAALQRDLAEASEGPCLPLFWSLAPIVRSRDIGFLQWLGVEIPPPYLRALQDAGGLKARERLSLATNVAMARNLLEHAEAEAHGPIGFCIEHVMRSNLEPAFDLIHALHEVIEEFGARPAVIDGQVA